MKSRRQSASARRLAERAHEIIATEISYIDNPSFRSKGASKTILGASLNAGLKSVEPAMSKRGSNRGLPAYFATLYDNPLLSFEEEQDLFRRMNYLRYRANLVRVSLDPDSPDEEQIAEYDSLIAKAEKYREKLVRCNLRLVVSIARRFAEDRVHLEDLISEGHLALLNAVDKFDYDRGFRFSTYATHAVQRTYFRSLKRRSRDRARLSTVGHEIIVESNEQPDSTDRAQESFDDFNAVASLIDAQLDPRERFILQARFGLDRPEGPQTLLEVARQMDLSKERVRQLQLRALEKLRQEAELLGLATGSGSA